MYLESNNPWRLICPKTNLKKQTLLCGIIQNDVDSLLVSFLFFSLFLFFVVFFLFFCLNWKQDGVFSLSPSGLIANQCPHQPENKIFIIGLSSSSMCKICPPWTDNLLIILTNNKYCGRQLEHQPTLICQQTNEFPYIFPTATLQPLLFMAANFSSINDLGSHCSLSLTPTLSTLYYVFYGDHMVFKRNRKVFRETWRINVLWLLG